MTIRGGKGERTPDLVADEFGSPREVIKHLTQEEGDSEFGDEYGTTRATVRREGRKSRRERGASAAGEEEGQAGKVTRKEVLAAAAREHPGAAQLEISSVSAPGSPAGERRGELPARANPALATGIQAARADPVPEPVAASAGPTAGPRANLNATPAPTSDAEGGGRMSADTDTQGHVTQAPKPAGPTPASASVGGGNLNLNTPPFDSRAPSASASARASVTPRSHSPAQGAGAGAKGLKLTALQPQWGRKPGDPLPVKSAPGSPVSPRPAAPNLKTSPGPPEAKEGPPGGASVAGGAGTRAMVAAPREKKLVTFELRTRDEEVQFRAHMAEKRAWVLSRKVTDAHAETKKVQEQVKVVGEVAKQALAKAQRKMKESDEEREKVLRELRSDNERLRKENRDLRERVREMERTMREFPGGRVETGPVSGGRLETGGAHAGSTVPTAPSDTLQSARSTSPASPLSATLKEDLRRLEAIKQSLAGKQKERDASSSSSTSSSSSSPIVASAEQTETPAQQAAGMSGGEQREDAQGAAGSAGEKQGLEGGEKERGAAAEAANKSTQVKVAKRAKAKGSGSKTGGAKADKHRRKVEVEGKATLHRSESLMV